MLDVINRLLHGYVALTVIRACDQSSLFELLSQDAPLSFDKTNDELGANSGDLKALLLLLKIFKRLFSVSLLKSILNHYLYAFYQYLLDSCNKMSVVYVQSY